MVVFIIIYLFFILFLRVHDISHLSDKVLAEGWSDPFPGVDTTVHPHGFLFGSSVHPNLKDYCTSVAIFYIYICICNTLVFVVCTLSKLIVFIS